MELRITKSDLKDLYRECKTSKELWKIAKERGFIFEFDESAGEVSIFARIYIAYRRTLHHSGLRMPRKGSQQWLLMEKVAIDAVNFCREFDLDIRAGFHEYLKTANSIKSLKLRVLSYKSETISRAYEAYVEITESPHKDDMIFVIDAYSAYCLRTCGMAPETKRFADKIHYLHAAVLCVKYNMQPQEFIEFLEDKWAWTGDMLKPHQLNGEKAEEYLQGRNSQQDVPKQRNIKRVFLPKGVDRYD